MASNQNFGLLGSNNFNNNRSGSDVKENCLRFQPPVSNVNSLRGVTVSFPLSSSSLADSPSSSLLPNPFPCHAGFGQRNARSKTAPRSTMRLTSPTLRPGQQNRSSTPPPPGMDSTPPGTFTLSDDAFSPPSFALDLPTHKTWSMGNAWEKNAGFMSSLQAFNPAALPREHVDKAIIVGSSIPHQSLSLMPGLPNPFPYYDVDIRQSDARPKTVPRSMMRQ